MDLENSVQHTTTIEVQEECWAIKELDKALQKPYSAEIMATLTLAGTILLTYISNKLLDKYHDKHYQGRRFFTKVDGGT